MELLVAGMPVVTVDFPAMVDSPQAQEAHMEMEVIQVADTQAVDTQVENTQMKDMPVDTLTALPQFKP